MVACWGAAVPVQLQQLPLLQVVGRMQLLVPAGRLLAAALRQLVSAAAAAGVVGAVAAAAAMLTWHGRCRKRKMQRLHAG